MSKQLHEIRDGKGVGLWVSPKEVNTEWFVPV